MKRLLLSLVLAVGFLAPVALASPAYAALDVFDKKDLCPKVNAKPDDSNAICDSSGGDPLTGPKGVLQNAATLIAILGGVFAVVMIVVSGISYITSNGDNEQISKAKRTLVYSVVGLFILVMARFLVGWIVNQL